MSLENSWPDPLGFFNKYELAGNSNNFRILKEKATVCRFCGRNSSQVTFKEETHLLPELLGVNDIVTFDECDECNNFFSGYESNLSTFIRPYITLTGTVGKNGVPNFQSRSENRDENTRTNLVHVSNTNKQLILTSTEDYEVDKENKKVKITFRLPPFVPLNVYKALVKIGLSLMPKEYDHFNKGTFDWLLNKNSVSNFINYGFHLTLKKARFKAPFAELYRAKSFVVGVEEFPEHTLILGFANQVFQIFLPFSDELKDVHDNSRTLSVDIFPLMMFDKKISQNEYEIKYMNLGIDYSLKYNHQIYFSFDSIEHLTNPLIVP